MIIYSHCHLNYEPLSLSLKETIDRANKDGVRYLLTISTEDKSYDKILNIVSKNECVFGSYGIHPHEAKNYEDLNRNKVFNYLIQALETESNIKKILKVQDYLLNKNTKLVLYGYDSFLFDFSQQDGVETLKDIKSILEENKHYTKSKMGLNYGEMQDITKRL